MTSTTDWKNELPGFAVRAVEPHEQGWRVTAQALARTSPCPVCGQVSDRLHSYYTRTLRDLPVLGQAVQWRLRVRRFVCLNAACPRHIFAERLTPLAAAHARRTGRLTEAVYALGQALGGTAGAAVARQLHMPVSADTTLRVLRQTPLPAVAPVRVLGVDDWAQRRGQVYGTILVDLERHRVLDLLDGRTADEVAHWLRAHPGVEIVARDRATEYSRGIQEGAPQAQQVADRWHLLHNLHEALHHALARLHATLPAVSAHVEVVRLPPLAPLEGSLGASARAVRAAGRERRLAQYQAVKTLQQQGHNILQITRLLPLSRPGVRRYYYADTFPEWGRHSRHPSILDPYVNYLQAQLDTGAHNAMQLWRDLRAQGFTGSPKQVKQWVHLRRTPRAPATWPSARQLAWLLLRAPDSLHPDEQGWLQALQSVAPLARAYSLAQQFRTLLRQRPSAANGPAFETFETWLVACEAAPVRELATFAAGLRADYSAVQAAVTLPWSNGPTEGFITRLKLLKRQMYGRAKLDLLRARLLYSP